MPLLDINLCTVKELTAKVGLPGELARQIIEYKKKRKRRPAIERLDELWYVPGMNHEVYKKIKRYYKSCNLLASSSNKNCNENSRTEPEGAKAHALEPNSVTLSQSGSKLSVTYISRIPPDITFLIGSTQPAQLCKRRSKVFRRKLSKYN